MATTAAAGEVDAALELTAEPLEAEEVRDRAKRGAMLMALRGIAIRILGFVGNLALARFLTPGDFGVVAVGAAIMMFGSYLYDGGFGAALIGGGFVATRRTYEQLLGLQLAIAVGVSALVAVVAPMVAGRTGWVTAMITSALCFGVIGLPGIIHLERNLMYRELAMIEIARSLTLSVWSVALAVAGAGVWSLASAYVFQAACGTLIVFRLSHLGRLRPRLGLSELRPLLGFGSQFMAMNFVNLIRDQGLNIGIAAVASYETLGVWTMAYRFIQIPYLLFESLWRVSFPAFARLMEVGVDPRTAVDRLMARSAVVTGLIICTLVGSLPALIPALFKPAWQPIVSILPWACAGFLVRGPVYIAVAGLLAAKGDAATGLRATLIHTIVSLTVALALLPVIGDTALGLGVLGSALADVFVMGRRAAHGHGVKIVGPLLCPTIAASIAGGLGWWTALLVRPHLLGVPASGSAALVVFLGLIGLLRPAALRDLIDVGRYALLSFLRARVATEAQ